MLIKLNDDRETINLIARDPSFGLRLANTRSGPVHALSKDGKSLVEVGRIEND